MDQNLPYLYRDYGKYSNYRNFPLDIDGLKPVERRVLLAAYKIAKDKLVKSRKVDAHTTGHYHPHGSCYGTIVQLVHQGFLIGQGSFGTNVGVEPCGPAADRYTECRLNPKTVELAFKYINHVPWIDTELDDKEPMFLPTLIPLCLMGIEYTQGIGFGYKTFIPCYNVKDLYQRLLWLLKIRKNKPIITPITDCNILSPPEVSEELLTTGKAKLDVQGIIDINTRTNSVILKSWPPGRRFESLLGKFSSELDSGMIGFTDLSVETTAIQFQVLRERNRDKIFTDFIEKLQESIKGSISFEITLVDTNQRVITKSVDQMLLDTFKMFSNVNEKMLQHEFARLEAMISEYNTLDKIKPVLINHLSKKLTPDKIINEIEKETSISKSVITTLLNKYKISKLLTLDTDTTNLTHEKSNIQKTLSTLDAFVLDQYSKLKI